MILEIFPNLIWERSRKVQIQGEHTPTTHSFLLPNLLPILRFQHPIHCAGIGFGNPDIPPPTCVNNSAAAKCCGKLCKHEQAHYIHSILQITSLLVYTPHHLRVPCRQTWLIVVYHLTGSQLSNQVVLYFPDYVIWFIYLYLLCLFTYLV